MPNHIILKNKIKNFNKKITVSGDKSISIRWVLFSSIASGVSNASNLLMSEDVLTAINAIKKLGIKVSLNKNICKIYGKGIDGYNYKKNLTLDSKNSGSISSLAFQLYVTGLSALINAKPKSSSSMFFFSLLSETCAHVALVIKLFQI